MADGTADNMADGTKADDENFFAFLRNDLMFKWVFLNEHLLKTLLSGVLDIAEERITELTVKNSEIPADAIGKKAVRLDIQVSFRITDKTCPDGRTEGITCPEGITHPEGRTCLEDAADFENEETLCDVEMQVVTGKYFLKRAAFYVHRMQEQKLSAGDKYKDVKKAVGVFFLLDNLFLSPKYYNVGVQKLLGTDEVVDDGVTMHYIELQKLDFADKVIDDSDTKMLLFKLLKADRREELTDMENINNATIQEIIGLINAYNADPKKRYLMQALEDGDLGMQMSLRAKYYDGRAEGRAEGKVEGRAEGKTEGKSEMAKRLIDENLPVELIARTSGFTVSEVERLRA